jgi:hypothetical protein
MRDIYRDENTPATPQPSAAHRDRTSHPRREKLRHPRSMERESVYIDRLSMDELVRACAWFL